MQLAIGLTIGLAGAFGVGRLLQSLLVQTGASDPVTLDRYHCAARGRLAGRLFLAGAPRDAARSGPRAAVRVMTIDAVRAMCRALPKVSEDIKWGHDLCFIVGGKMFAVVSMEPPHSIAFKCTPETFGELVERPGIIPRTVHGKEHVGAGTGAR